MEPTQLDRIEKMLREVLAATAARKPVRDEKIHRDPGEKYWTGRSYKGSNLSDCPVDYLAAFARYKEACVYMASKPDAAPSKAQYVDKDKASAALAYAWAEYRQATKGAPLASSPAPADDDPAGDLPF